LRQRR